MTLPSLAIVFYTHCRGDDRERYAATTIESTLANVAWPGRIRVHVADDRSDPERLERILNIVRRRSRYHLDGTISHTVAGGRGYGASHNEASQVVHPDADIVLAVEDDWECLRTLPLTRLAAYFDHPEVNAIRLGYVGWTQHLRGRFFKAHTDTVLLFDPDSPEPHVNAGHPRLERVSYQRAVGPWAEGVDAGAVEFDWCMRAAAREGVVWPVDLIHPSHNGGYSYFAHIGTVQARDDQGS